MTAYHHLLSHFPVALWFTASLVIFLRVFSDGSLAKAAARVLTPLLVLGAIAGSLTYLVGFLLFPFDGLLASPLSRNHVLTATWGLAYWTLLVVLSWRLGEQVWEGTNRWAMLILAVLGASLVAITGTLGGSLAGTPSGMPELLRLFGFEVYRTFYVPTFMLAIIGVATVILVVLGYAGRRR